MKNPNTLNKITAILCEPGILNQIRAQADELARLIHCAKADGKIITIYGNGGSAADAQHWAAELVCTYKSRERTAYPAVALTTDTSIITAWSNDFEFKYIFSRQVEAFARMIGLSIGISTSGRSINVLNGLRKAKDYAARTVLISGNGVEESIEVDLHVRFPSSDTPTVQTLTQIMYHEVCELLEKLQ